MSLTINQDVEDRLVGDRASGRLPVWAMTTGTALEQQTESKPHALARIGMRSTYRFAHIATVHSITQPHTVKTAADPVDHDGSRPVTNKQLLEDLADRPPSSLHHISFVVGS
jgi:hypothetical protein